MDFGKYLHQSVWGCRTHQGEHWPMGPQHACQVPIPKKQAVRALLCDPNVCGWQLAQEMGDLKSSRLFCPDLIGIG